VRGEEKRERKTLWRKKKKGTAQFVRENRLGRIPATRGQSLSYKKNKPTGGKGALDEVDGITIKGGGNPLPKREPAFGRGKKKPAVWSQARNRSSEETLKLKKAKKSCCC